MRTLVVLAAVTLAVTGCAPAVAFTTTDGASTSPSAAASSSTTLSAAPPAATAPAETDAAKAVVAPVGSFVLGDSISLGVGPLLARLGYPVVGRVGQSVTEAYLQAHLTTPEAQEAPAWVLILGTNNPGDATDVAQLDGWLDLVDELRATGAEQDVYWVTPYRDPRYSGGLSEQGLAAFNTELARQSADRPWLHVVDFATVAALHPEWFDADGSHLHPDDAGYGVLAALIAGPDAVPLLTPAPLQTLDGPTTDADDGPAHPTTRPSATRSATATPSPSAAAPEPSAVPESAAATSADPAPVDTATQAPAEAAAPEFSPAG